jgi:hypothetical protein
VTESSAETTGEMLARVRASFDRQAMMSTLGVEVTAVGPGRVEMSHDRPVRPSRYQRLTAGLRER